MTEAAAAQSLNEKKKHLWQFTNMKLSNSHTATIDLLHTDKSSLQRSLVLPFWL